MRALLAVMLVASAPALAQDRCDNCGRIESIRPVTERTSWTPLGAMATSPGTGEYTGQPGRVTQQYNFTTGNVVLLGAAGGAGYARRPSAYERPRWEIKVKMESGGVRTVSNDYEPALRDGDRVRVYGTQVELFAT